jgi:hypothetical protein
VSYSAETLARSSPTFADADWVAQFLHTGEDVADAAHGAFGHLQQGVGFRDVPLGDLDGGDVSPEALGNGEPCRIVLGRVDPIARRESFQRFAQVGVRNIQVLLSVHCRDVVLNSESHDL